MAMADVRNNHEVATACVSCMFDTFLGGCCYVIIVALQRFANERFPGLFITTLAARSFAADCSDLKSKGHRTSDIKPKWICSKCPKVCCHTVAVSHHIP